MSHVPHDVLSQGGSSTLRARRSQKVLQTEVSRESNVAPDGTFLDFLYPPQALAWLQRSNGRQWQRWERRNARRLPEGFVVASRGYASQPIMHDDVGEIQDSPREDYTAEEDARIPEDTGLGQEARAGAYVSDASEEHEWVQSRFADTPGELTERESISGRAEPAPSSSEATPDSLRSVMVRSRSGKAHDRTDLIEKAITIYESLREAKQADVRLRREMLEWLSLQGEEMVKKTCISIYKSIPMEERTLEIYHAGMFAFLPRDWATAIPKLHQEALQNVENGQQLSWRLFRYAMDNANWGLAAQTAKIHYERYVNTRQASQIEVFWLHVSETPDLLHKAIQMHKQLRQSQKSGHAQEAPREFYASLFREAISQEFPPNKASAPTSKETPDYARQADGIRELLAYLATSDMENAAAFFEDTIFAMLKPSSRKRYAGLHRVVSFAYARYCKLHGVHPPEQLFHKWLIRLTDYADTMTDPPKTSTSMSIPHLIRQWTKYHGRVARVDVKRLMAFHARSGNVTQYNRWLEYLRLHYPDYHGQRNALWTMIWLHTKRGDLDEAQQAFAEVQRAAQEHGEVPELKCWNMLLQAHARADDLEGALVNLQNLIQYSNEAPDEFTIGPILSLLGKRGDADGIENLLRQFDAFSPSHRHTQHIATLILAHVNNDNMESAETVLRQSIIRVRNGQIKGLLTRCFNIILTGYSARRDIGATLQTYRWMKAEGARADGNSYAAIMQALVVLRRTTRARGVMTHVMARQGIEPTALHYAILIAGYVNNREPGLAVAMYKEMRAKGIRPTVSTNTAHLKAEAILESRRYKLRRTRADIEPEELKETIEELKTYLQSREGQMIPPPHANLGLGVATFDVGYAAPAAYFEFLILVHGRRRCFEAVRELHRLYMEEAEKYGRGQDAPPVRLLASLASAQLDAGEYADVDECWRLAKEQADRAAPLVPVPRFKIRGSKTPEPDAQVTQAEPSEDAVQEDAAQEDVEEERGSEDVEDAFVAFITPDIKSKRSGSSHDQENPLQAPAPGRRYVLSKILHYHLSSLSLQNRMLDAINTVMQVLGQGYTMDIRAWNGFIRNLCRHSPPLNLLAFVLAERFLTPNFPGWTSRGGVYPPTSEDNATGLQHINARYLPPGKVMPRYASIVRLAGTLLDVRRAEATGAQKADVPPELAKYIGNLQQIRRLAPKTLRLVQSLPRINDAAQAKHLGD